MPALPAQPDIFFKITSLEPKFDASHTKTFYLYDWFFKGSVLFTAFSFGSKHKCPHFLHFLLSIQVGIQFSHCGLWLAFIYMQGRFGFYFDTMGHSCDFCFSVQSQISQAIYVEVLKLVQSKSVSRIQFVFLRIWIHPLKWL